MNFSWKTLIASNFHLLVLVKLKELTTSAAVHFFPLTINFSLLFRLLEPLQTFYTLTWLIKRRHEHFAVWICTLNILLRLHRRNCSFKCVWRPQRDKTTRRKFCRHKLGRVSERKIKIICAVTLHNVYYTTTWHRLQTWIMHQTIFKVTQWLFFFFTTPFVLLKNINDSWKAHFVPAALQKNYLRRHFY